VPRDIREYVHWLCAELGICQRELARRLHVHPATLSKWSRHVPRPLALQALTALADANGLAGPGERNLGNVPDATSKVTEVATSCIVCGTPARPEDDGICIGCRTAHAGSNRCINCGAVEDRPDLPFVCDECRVEFGT